MEQDDGVTVGDEVVLYGMVGDDYMGQGFTAKAVVRSLAGVSGDITVRLNSGGGIAWEGAAIHAALMGYKKKGKVTVRVEGIAASAASLIAMAGDRIEMAQGAMLMIHDPSALTYGTAGDHRQSAEMLEKLAQNYADVYAARAGMKPQKARELMLAETWMTAKEAVEMGFADEMVDAAPAMAAAFDYTVFAKAPVELVTMAKERGWVLARSGDQPQAAVVATRPVVMTRHFPQTEQTIMTDDNTPAPVMVADTAKIELAAEIAKASTAERDRVKMITTKANKLGLPVEFADDLIDRGVSLEAAAVAMIDKLAERSPQTIGAPAPTARVLVDERDTMKDGIEAALVAMLARKAPQTDKARAFMGMGLAEMAATINGAKPPRTYVQRESVLMNTFHSPSDFPGLFENALNKQLLSVYTAQEPVYRLVSSPMNFNDFRPHPVLRAGDFPDLQPIATGGEILSGTMSESRETVTCQAHAIKVDISRQFLINDDLDSISAVMNDRGRMVAQYEDGLFFTMLLSASGAGPTLLTTGRAVFNTTDVSLAASGAALSLTTLSTAKAAMLSRRGIDTSLREAAPRFLLVGPALETVARQLVTPISADSAANVSVFADGSLQVVVSSRITGNAWYLFADPANVPNFKYGFLRDSEQPRLRTYEPFGYQGLQMSLEHDFGVGAIDFRGGFRNAGA